MWGMASQLNDATIEAISVYYSTQPPAPAKAADGKLMARGKQILNKGIAAQGVPACAPCHGSQARGTDLICAHAMTTLL
jgi:cytochrome c553